MASQSTRVSALCNSCLRCFVKATSKTKIEKQKCQAELDDWLGKGFKNKILIAGNGKMLRMN